MENIISYETSVNLFSGFISKRAPSAKVETFLLSELSFVEQD